MKKLRFLFFEKIAYHSIRIYGNCLTNNFLMATKKFFQVTLKLPKNVLKFFFNRKLKFVFKQIIFNKNAYKLRT